MTGRKVAGKAQISEHTKEASDLICVPVLQLNRLEQLQMKLLLQFCALYFDDPLLQNLLICLMHQVLDLLIQIVDLCLKIVFVLLKIVLLPFTSC